MVSVKTNLFLVESLPCHTCWYNEQETFGKHRNVSEKHQIICFYIPLQFYDGPEGSNAKEKTQLKEKAQVKRKHK